MSNKPVIKTSKNGPYVLLNLKKIIESDGNTFKIKESGISLCRCGGSCIKPFCDGTHGKIGWTDEKSEDRVPRRLDTYKGKEITIHDDRGICSHAGYCTNGLPEVFQMGEEPWIDPNGASAEKIIETIKKCPSGALSYTINGEKFDSFHDTPNIKVSEGGPYRITGGIKLEDDDTPESKEHYSLCRCGQSKNKPFCDGQHWYENLEDNGKVKRKEECSCSHDEPYNNKYNIIKKLAVTGKSEHTAMRTFETFTDWSAILFKGTQLSKMPLNEDEPVNTTTIIGKSAKQPLKISMPLYVSHMSYGALSKEAKIALAKGTTLVDTAMCSGEGGMLKESQEAAKKYIYELGTADFSHDEGNIVKADAVELKIGQAVKPGVGDHFPSRKISPEIAEVRGIKPYEEFVSPARMSGINNIDDLIKKVKRIRKITDGKPVGIKFAAGHIEEDIEYALKAYPDFITLDCRGGATGSSPKFIKDNTCIPPIYAVRRARQYLDSVDSKVTLCVTGGFRNSTDIAKAIALGADAIALATASMIAIGCIQSKVCHTGACPVGIATQDKALRDLFDEKRALNQFKNFYLGTNDELKVLARSNGKDNIHNLNLNDIVTIDNEVAEYTDIQHA